MIFLAFYILTYHQDHLVEWLKFRNTFLDELLRHDGLGDFLGHTKCSNCQKAPGVIKCKDCPSGRMLKCPECIVASYATLPLHRVEVSQITWWGKITEDSHDIVDQRWNREFFDKDSLQNLRLCYQVGHSEGPCPCPLTGPKNFVVFDIMGFHSIMIKYCNCGEQPLINWTQLLHKRWFPATLLCPQTVFTFDCLETFHEITLQGKTSLYDYYHTLLRRSDNANIYTSIVSHVLLSFI